MKRDLYHELIDWKDSHRRKPLIVQGARQVGKTHLVESFAKENFEQLARFNFEEEPALQHIFSGKLSATQICRDLETLSPTPIVQGRTLLFLDEIQACPRAMSSLKYFAEQAPDLHVVAAGSLLGIKSKDSFPVGKVNFLTLHPMSFSEFLRAVGLERLDEACQSSSFSHPTNPAIHESLMRELRNYMLVGGMPEAIVAYRSAHRLQEARDVHRELLRSYELDFAKHAEELLPKITQVWESIPLHLAKENKKFIFGAVRKGARASTWEDSLTWLKDAGLIQLVRRIKTPKLPLKSYAEENIFKVYMMDTGLLASQSQLPISAVLDESRLFVEFKGALTENIVAQEMRAAGRDSLYYWESSGTAEVDFLIDHEGAIYPLEVKSGATRKKRSLLVYGDKYHPPILSRATTRNLKLDQGLKNYPLYLVGKFSTNPNA